MNFCAYFKIASVAIQFVALFSTGGQSDQGYGSKDELVKEDGNMLAEKELVAKDEDTDTGSIIRWIFF